MVARFAEVGRSAENTWRHSGPVNRIMNDTCYVVLQSLETELAEQEDVIQQLRKLTEDISTQVTSLK